MRREKTNYCSARKAAAMLLAIATLLVFMPPSQAASPYFFVYTENGKNLNVRSAPGGQVIDTIAYGTPVVVFDFEDSDSWALIHYGSPDRDGWVMTRYLVLDKPAPKKKPSAPQIVDDTLAMVNAQFQKMQSVTPYQVKARPSRAGGFVNMRWAPSTDVHVMQRCYNGYELYVIAQNSTWAQVEDRVTGQVGFMVRKYMLDNSGVGSTN